MRNQHFVRTEMFGNKLDIFSCSPSNSLLFFKLLDSLCDKYAYFL